MKRYFALILVLVLCLSLCACGGEAVNTTEPSTDATEGTVSVQTNPPVETEAPTEPATTIEVVEVPIGSMLSTDFVEMSFNEVTVAHDIQYSVKTGVVTRITGPNPVSGQQYVCLTGTIKNTSTTPLPVYDFFAGKFVLDGYTYEVDANNCDILDGEGLDKSEIDPLMEYTFRLYTAIPDSLADSHSSCSFTFGFYDLFDNKELAYNRAVADDAIALCPYQFVVPVK